MYKSKKLYSFLVTFFYALIIAMPVFAENEWYGKWQSDPMTFDNETVVMEYDFKNDSELTMSFITDNKMSNVGRCVSRISLDGSYNSVGPIFFVSLDSETLRIEIIKLKTAGNSISESAIRQEIRKNAVPLCSGYDNVGMIYVTHEDSEDISFIYGDENNAMEIEFHRPQKSIEELLNISEDKERSNVENVIQSEDKPKPLNPIVQMWKSMGFFLLYLFIAFPLIFLIKFLFAKNIKRTNPATRSVMIRRYYYVVRFIVRIIVIIIGLILWVSLLMDAIKVNKYIGITVIMGGGGLLLYLLSSLSLPMNFTTMRGFMKKKRNYILYLRGFITDDYFPVMDETAKHISETRPWKVNIDDNKGKINPNSLPLNERELSKAWKKYAQVYSVGLPEELESPEGSKRIYLDNQTWQQDVLQLMKDAKLIIIRINSNDNCIWEIEQCCSLYTGKTVYYIEDIEILKEILEKMGTRAPVCLRSSKIDQNHMYAYQANGEIIVHSYINDMTGLSKSVTHVVWDLNKIKR